MSDNLDPPELSKVARNKLQMLSNHLFEELAMDVYDEVDRRETEAVWLSMLSSNLLVDRSTVPFLPVNPEFSSTRNQGRQKLARYNAREFATLIIDILLDAKRRQFGNTSSLFFAPESCSSLVLKQDKLVNSDAKRVSQVSDDEPLYDSVASDEDYITSEQVAELVKKLAEKDAKSLVLENKLKELQPTIKEEDEKKEEISAVPKEKQPKKNPVDNLTALEENFKKLLSISETKLNGLQNKIQILQSTVVNLEEENRNLRNVIQHAGLSLPCPVQNGHKGNDSASEQELKSVKLSQQRPVSMFETREMLRSSGMHHYLPSSSSFTAKWESSEMNETDGCLSISGKSIYNNYRTVNERVPFSQEIFKSRRSSVTRKIAELWKSMQENKTQSFVPCAESISIAVAELIAIIPQEQSNENIISALRQLNSNTVKLQAECAGLQRHTSDSASDEEKAQCVDKVRSCAYNIAKAIKELVNILEGSN